MLTFPTEAVLSLAHQAGSAILAEIPLRKEYRSKSNGSPVTNADIASHRILEAGLRKLTPDIPILSEESCEQFNLNDPSLVSYWVIDPLDGTRDFIQGTNEFTVNIALVDQGKAIFGIVHAPALDTTYFAMQGKGAYKKISNHTPQRLQLSYHAQLPLRIAVSRNHPSEKLREFLNHLPILLSDSETLDPLQELITPIPCGSALKFGWIAEARIDLYPRFGTTSLWDTAAGQCVVEEAGGQVLDQNGQSLRYFLNHGFKNPHFLVIADLDSTRTKNYLHCIHSL